MLRGTQLEGLRELLCSIRGEEESDNSLSRERMKRFVSAAISNGLTKRQRELITLIYVDGISQKEAAKRLGMSQSAVSEMKKRAIGRLKRLAVFMV